ncbi:MAG TPA: hypothetical protein VK400_15520 [Pyrinomonadaceae bacterium]|nr:hypothetical protein [Pyrinomonadaceae bacterium]
MNRFCKSPAFNERSLSSPRSFEASIKSRIEVVSAEPSTDFFACVTGRHGKFARLKKR